MNESIAHKPFHVMVKPVGPTCNLDCEYCYYLSKEQLLFADARPAPRLSDEQLEQFTRDYIDAHRGNPEINFAWQGGEPTMLGVEFFRRAVELQKKHAPPGVQISNSIQTNGTLLDDELCRFFAGNNFLVGLSLDGPRDLHDAYRRDKAGRPTFDRVMAGLELLHKHRVPFNALVVVNRKNAARPVDVYRFLRDQARVQFIQFIPCVEPTHFSRTAPQHWSAEMMPRLGEPTARPGPADSAVTPWSVDPDEFGRFLCRVFDEWLVHDVGQVFVQTFDTALGLWMGLGSSLCVFAETCGLAVAMERDGQVYACDHYVYPEYRIGQLGQRPLGEMVRTGRQEQFGRDKTDKLPQLCRECEVYFACHGECPKNRFLRTPDGEPGLNYLCAGWKKFFTHINPWMKLMAQELRSGRPAANVMQMARGGDDYGQSPYDRDDSGDGVATEDGCDQGEISQTPRGSGGTISRGGGQTSPRAEKHDQAGRAGKADRNDPCPCGSGRKFKKCCMTKRP